MEVITCKVSCGFTEFQTVDAHLGQDALYLQATILHTRQLVDKMTK
jgi:hypothetical protein